jgi:RNA polymerase sigma-70 factor, ECF subfamily
MSETEGGNLTEHLITRAAGGDARAMGALFSRFRDRLRTMVRLRMDHRLQGRVDPSDVLQDAYLEAAQRIGDYAAKRPMPFFLWLRFLTAQRLLNVHRHHLATKMRDARGEILLHQRPAAPEATSISLAAHLLGQFTSPDDAAARAELQQKLQDALNGMDSTDREVLTLRHFEELSNKETAEVLGLTKTAASNRYVRALERLRTIMKEVGLL